MEFLRQKTILIAAASEPSREALAAEFRRHGSQVHSVPGGSEAYELARTHAVDAVLASAELASGSPQQLVSDIHRLSHEVPVLLFGMVGVSVSQTQALHFGYAACFHEGQPAELLLEATARCLAYVDERKQKRNERVAVPAHVSVTWGDPPITIQAPVLNVSRGGFFIRLERDFPLLESRAQFCLTLAKAKTPNDDPASATGNAVVRWVRERASSGQMPGVGFEFVELGEEATRFLRAYLERQRVKRP